MKRGVKLGADIPYCILKGTALSEGIGEKLSTIPAMPSCYILIAKPNIHVSTKWVYTNLVLDEHPNHPDIDGMLASMKKRDLLSLSNQIGNVLESVTIPAYPQIAAIKECILQNLKGINQSCARTTEQMHSQDTYEGFVRSGANLQGADKEKYRELPYRCFVFVTDLYR